MFKVPIHLQPKLVSVFREGYSFQQLYHDIIAGIIVGIVALPLSIALAIASGVSPERGLYTAIVAGFFISFLGGSRVQIGGPTGAFIVVVYSIVQQYGYDGLAVATIMAGVMLILMGLAQFGAVIKFIPFPLTVGFTGGIAVIIFAAQIRDFLGLTMPSPPADFVHKMVAYWQYLPTINPYAMLLGIMSLLILLYWPRISHRIPAPFVVIIVMTVIVQLLGLIGIHVETIGDRFGSIPNTLPTPAIPALSWDLLKQLSSPAFTIAILAAIESLLSAVIADGMLGTRHRSNMELIGQGVANIASPLFGGIPATGAIARTATNIKNGGRTPIAGIVHAITLLLIMLVFAKWAALIPMTTLAAILMLVAYNMSEWHIFVKLLKSTKSDIMVLFVTFLLTVFIDLTVAIETGIVLAAFLFMHHMAESTEASYLSKTLQEEDDDEDADSLARYTIPHGVEVFEINGPFFFGAADKFKDQLYIVEEFPKVLILRMRFVPTLDATGLDVLEDVYEEMHKGGTVLMLTGVNTQPMMLLKRSGLFDRIGAENICSKFGDAVNRARGIVEKSDTT